MTVITTESGTVYTLANGRMTREAEVNKYLAPDLQVPSIVNEPVRLVNRPVVGLPMTIKVLRTGRYFTTTAIVTVSR